jgi:tRNA (cytidine/uridine-2'-O-)-methyltransferase
MFHVLLFEPEIPPNTGNIIRLCANTGATLHLIKPLGFGLDDKNLRRSGLDYHDLTAVKIHEDFSACLHSLAAARLFAVETGARRGYHEPAFRAGDAFLFGPETRGLPKSALERVDRENTLSIPMRPQSRSINLSNAVALVIFEAWRQTDFAGRSGA